MREWCVELGAYSKGATGFRVVEQSHWVWAPVPLESQVCQDMSSPFTIRIWNGLHYQLASFIFNMTSTWKLQDWSQITSSERCWFGKITKLILRKDNKMIHFQVLGMGGQLFISIWNNSLNRYLQGDAFYWRNLLPRAFCCFQSDSPAFCTIVLTYISFPFYWKGSYSPCFMMILFMQSVLLKGQILFNNYCNYFLRGPFLIAILFS